MIFPERLSWDIDLATLNEEKHGRFIMERVLQRGDINEWNLLKERFDNEKIKEEVVNIRTLDYKTLIFLVLYWTFQKSNLNVSILYLQGISIDKFHA